MSGLVVAGLSGESGKTFVCLGLLLAARREGVAVQAYKKGPDYIDAAWLSWASGGEARNLDTYLMGRRGVRESFERTAVAVGFNLVEGNRGLHDGSDARGTHSTAELAKLLDAPVLLVVNATKVTRTVAAMVLGCQRIDPEVRIAGVVLNQIGSSRHEKVIRESVESACSIPVLGAIPRLRSGALLTERHLGLIPPAERGDTEALAGQLLDACTRHVDVAAVMALAREKGVRRIFPEPKNASDTFFVRVGVVRDSAFTFYYPENLEALAAGGAEIVRCSALDAAGLPDRLDALYIGGGFPETHAHALAANRPFLDSLRQAARNGLPVFAECGGLMLLSQSIWWQGKRYRMAGALPFDVDVCPGPPQGHGYVDLQVDTPNPYFPVGTTLRGHEFHYSRIMNGDRELSAVCQVTRGTGCGNRRDGLVVNNVWAAYTHLHALGAPEWASGILQAARRHASGRKGF